MDFMWSKTTCWGLYFVAECTKSSENYQILCVPVFLGGGLQNAAKITLQNQEKLDLMRVLRFLVLLEPREICVNEHM